MLTLALCSRKVAERLAGVYVRVLDLVLPRLRRVAMRNLRLALPELGEDEHRRIADGSFRSIARILVSLSRFPEMNKENISEWIRYEGLEHFEEAKRRGKGVLFATAHLGNWELSAFAHALMTEPMHVVVRPLDNPSIDGMVRKLRTMSGNQVIEKKDYARGILRALSRNEAVGILIDQNMSLDEGIFVPFFGVAACVGTGFAKIAGHSGAAIIPGFALWSDEEGRYILKFHEPLLSSGNVEEDTRRIHAQLESVIRGYPEQWLWMHRRWKTRPSGEPQIY
ncbi:MAG: lysophospholipid acyltransferase family protein [Acidimicrobiia bacterium]|nr:lysophospholipid acyltransferase family protein [Acidimicrobiia bacterium]